MRRITGFLDRSLVAVVLLAAASVFPHILNAQATGTVTGTVVREGSTEPLSGVTVEVAGTALAAVTGPDGRFTLYRVPTGPQTLVLRRFGHRPGEENVTVQANATVTVEVGMAFQPVTLAEVVVSGASRTPERVVDAPAAVTVVDPARARDLSVTGQAPIALATIPGVDVVQSGVNDFNVNARGFNSSLNRRILVLQDGRDLAVPFLGSQEWSGFAMALDEVGRIEMVRGPGSALYGANAFSGVLNVITPPARDVKGTKLTVAGGELETFRVDGRHAGVAAEGRFGYKIAGGYNRSDTWSRSRTRLDGTSLQQEYASATDSAVGLAVERVALAGQSADPTTGVATGERDEIYSIYGSGRFDFYAPNGAIFSVDGGATQSNNEIAVTGIGRVQILQSLRPWARAAYAADNFNVMAWYTGRNTTEPQVSLLAGAPLEETSALLHFEAQYNRAFNGDRGRVVVGGSARNHRVDTKLSLMEAANDDRSDNFFAGYAQLEYKVVPQVRLVAAARVDDGDLYDTQFSPKGAIVFSPTDEHSIRFTFNRAFQVPNYSEFYLRAPAGAPQTGPRTLELGIEQYFASVRAALGAGVADLNLPTNLPWQFDSATVALALGNGDLDVESVNSWELGYKGTISDRFYVTVDGYISRLKNFVTDLLPAVNQDFPVYALTDAGTDIPKNLNDLEARINALEAGGAISSAQAAALRAPIPALRAGYTSLNATALQGLFATLPAGNRAVVVSYTNAGRVIERGIELGFGALLADEVKLEGTYTFFDFDVKEQQLGDVLLPNTPEHKGALTLSYQGRQGFDASVTGRFVDGYRWAAGVFQGFIPSGQTFDASVGYAVNNNVRLHVIATNVFDQDRFQIYGGSVIGRRVLGGVTATF